jgi:hypothetical protein
LEAAQAGEIRKMTTSQRSADNRARADEANARNGLEPFAVVVSAMLPKKPLLDRRDLRLA